MELEICFMIISPISVIKIFWKHMCCFVSNKIFNILYLLKCKLNKNTQGAKKSEAKSEAPVSFYSYMRLKSVISGGGQGPSCLLATMYGQLHIN